MFYLCQISINKKKEICFTKGTLELCRDLALTEDAKLPSESLDELSIFSMSP